MAKVLKIELIPQKASNLCWAACIEMVLKGFGKTVTQGEIVDSYNKIWDESNENAAVIEAITNPTIDTSFFNPIWNVTITEIGYESYWDVILLKHDYLSFKIQVEYGSSGLEKLNWSMVKHLLTKKIGLILVLSQIDSSDSSHAVVVRKAMGKGINKQILVNDPFDSYNSVNVGSTYSLSWDNLVNGVHTKIIKLIVVFSPLDATIFDLDPIISTVEYEVEAFIDFTTIDEIGDEKVRVFTEDNNND